MISELISSHHLFLV